MHITVNQVKYAVNDSDLDRRLISLLRNTLHLTGTRLGCGIGQCGACTIHVDGEAARSCLLSVKSVLGRNIVTIEGLGDGIVNPVQLALQKHQAPQCGFCMSGQVMTAAALFSANKHPAEQEISDAMRENLCRCGGYSRIKRALLELSHEQRT